MPLAPPPAPAVAGADRALQRFGHPASGTRQAQKKRGEKPGCPGPLAALQERAGEIMKSALAARLLTAVAFQSGLVVIRPPGTDVEALTAATRAGPLFPAQRLDVGLTGFGMEEGVERRHHRHS